MAKKSKRRKPNYTRKAAPVVDEPDTTPSRSVDLAAEYDYVLADLRRVAIIALALIAGLVILSFIL
ncbi:MAG: hypothetical protein Kow00124_07050 [Anaerolineae bacterium]